MSETQQMNNEAARSPTGEILDQTPPPETATTTDSTSTSTSSQDQTSTTSTETKPPNGQTTDQKATTTPAVPEKYTDFRAPDGYTIDPKTIEAATPIFKELGLSQEAAQKLVDFHSAQMIAAAKAPQATYEATRTEWQNAVKSDAEITAYAKDGKTGLDAVKIDISKALNVLGDAKLTSDFRDAMNLTGAGDNPAFIKTFWKLAQRITEGSHVAGKGPSPAGQTAPGSATKPSPAKSLYPGLA